MNTHKCEGMKTINNNYLVMSIIQEEETNRWSLLSLKSGDNFHIYINYCPICGRKL